ncbi:LPXTG cell wall anchor domain-containing protein [Lacticaseibacillus suibinensis]|uniref:LPXTG cell wall anchor domain-containing protein n=1 Tax=Lacticaseibacillus suibinensis TaxID=2486011 RepID=UPI000F79EF3B|nr:LPXTG cell wall anchor domain-containing protein [Lacticaseibacillus suibinensis]
MYGNISKSALVGASVLPATGSVLSPWLTLVGYAVVGITLASFAYLKHIEKSVRP